MMKRTIAIALSLCIVWPQALAASAREPSQPSLAQLVDKPYLDLLELSVTLRLTPKEIEEFKRQLEKEKETEKKRPEQEEELLKTQIELARKQLDKLNNSASRDTEEMTADDQRRREVAAFGNEAGGAASVASSIASLKRSSFGIGGDTEFGEERDRRFQVIRAARQPQRPFQIELGIRHTDEWSTGRHADEFVRINGMKRMRHLKTFTQIPGNRRASIPSGRPAELALKPLLGSG
jgi:hypothetical protein